MRRHGPVGGAYRASEWPHTAVQRLGTMGAEGFQKGGQHSLRRQEQSVCFSLLGRLIHPIQSYLQVILWFHMYLHVTRDSLTQEVSIVKCFICSQKSEYQSKCYHMYIFFLFQVQSMCVSFVYANRFEKRGNFARNTFNFGTFQVITISSEDL